MILPPLLYLVLFILVFLCDGCHTAVLQRCAAVLPFEAADEMAR